MKRVIDHDDPTATFQSFAADTDIATKIETYPGCAILHRLSEEEISSVPFANPSKIKVKAYRTVDKRGASIQNYFVEYTRRRGESAYLERGAINEFIERFVVSKFTQYIEKCWIEKSVGRSPRIDGKSNHRKHFWTYKYRITSVTIQLREFTAVDKPRPTLLKFPHPNFNPIKNRFRSIVIDNDSNNAVTTHRTKFTRTLRQRHHAD
jgi:hypothetical protein